MVLCVPESPLPAQEGHALARLRGRAARTAARSSYSMGARRPGARMAARASVHFRGVHSRAVLSCCAATRERERERERESEREREREGGRGGGREGDRERERESLQGGQRGLGQLGAAARLRARQPRLRRPGPRLRRPVISNQCYTYNIYIVCFIYITPTPSPWPAPTAAGD
jgi:hypothetical protein